MGGKINKISILRNILKGEPLGNFVDAFDVVKRGVGALTTSVSNLWDDIKEAIDRNTELTQQRMKQIIVEGTNEIKQNIIKCGDNVDEINKEIAAGIQDIERRLYEAKVAHEQELEDNFLRISQGFEQLLDGLNLQSEIEGILAGINNGQGVVDSFIYEDLKSLEEIISGLNGICTGLGQTITDCAAYRVQQV